LPPVARSPPGRGTRATPGRGRQPAATQGLAAATFTTWGPPRSFSFSSQAGVRANPLDSRAQATRRAAGPRAMVLPHRCPWLFAFV